MPPVGVRWRGRRGTGTSVRTGAGSALVSSPISARQDCSAARSWIATSSGATWPTVPMPSAASRASRPRSIGGSRRPVVRRVPRGRRGQHLEHRGGVVEHRAQERHRVRAVAHREPVRGVRDGGDDRRVREPVDGRGQGAGHDLDLQQQRDGPPEHPLRALPPDPAPLGRPSGLVLGAQLQRERLALPALGLLPGRVRPPGDQLRRRPHVVLGLGLGPVHELGGARVGRAGVAGVGVAEQGDVVLLRPQDGGLGEPGAGVEDGDERACRRAEVLEVGSARRGCGGARRGPRSRCRPGPARSRTPGP